MSRRAPRRARFTMLVLVLWLLSGLALLARYGGEAVDASADVLALE